MDSPSRRFRCVHGTESPPTCTSTPPKLDEENRFESTPSSAGEHAPAPERLDDWVTPGAAGMLGENIVLGEN